MLGPKTEGSGGPFFKVFSVWLRTPLLAPSWPHFGSILPSLGLILAPSWPLLALSWPHFGLILALLASLGALLASSWPRLGPLSCNPGFRPPLPQVEKSIRRPPWISQSYGGEHQEASLALSELWGRASGGLPGSLRAIEEIILSPSELWGSIRRPPWIAQTYGEDHQEASPGSPRGMGEIILDLSKLWGKGIRRFPWMSQSYREEHQEASLDLSEL